MQHPTRPLPAAPLSSGNALASRGTARPPPATALRIAYVTETYPPELNGVAASAARVVEQMRLRGWAVDLVRPRQPHERARDDDDELRTASLPIPMYPDLRLGLVRSERLMRRWRARRPTVVHIATEGPLGQAALRAAQRLALPVTSDFRTNFHAYSRHYGLAWAEPLVLAYLRRFHNRSQRSFVPTEAMKSMLEDAGFERLEVVGRGVDAERFSPAHRDPQLRSAWGLRDTDPAVLYVGRLAAEKNVQLVFDGFRALSQRARGARLVIVGDGPLRARLVREHPEAVFTGPQRGEALARHYASSDLFLFPSLTDTFGNVLLEAMASGLMIVAFDAGAARAHMSHGRNALLVPPGDRQSFVATAGAAGTQQEALAHLRRAARASALTLGWDAVLKRFEASLLEVAQQVETPRHAPLAV